MGEPASTADSRKILNELLEQDDLDDGAWLARARALRERAGLPVFGDLIHGLTHIRIAEREAEAIWPALLAHRREMSMRLGRDVGIRVAVFDWFVNIDPRLKNPKVVEFAQFERTERSAMTDWLTGLLNRGAFRASALRELRRAQRYGQRLSLILFDLDGFKGVNDQHGHETGDTLLREAGRVIRASVRDVDTAARFGGEEFIVLLPETAREGAVAVAERIREAMRPGIELDGASGERLAVTISGGVAVYPDDGEDLNDLLRRADGALYRAKESGRDRIVPQFVERRAARRLPLIGRELRATARRHDLQQVPAELRDVSGTGLGLNVGFPTIPGEPLTISVDSPAGGPPLVLAGNVVWCSAQGAAPADDAGTDPGFPAGVVLEAASRASAAAVIDLLLAGRSARAGG